MNRFANTLIDAATANIPFHGGIDLFVFESMAVTIMLGLGFATILTLLVVPVLYTMFHRIKYRPLAELE